MGRLDVNFEKILRDILVFWSLMVLLLYNIKFYFKTISFFV